MTDSQHSSRGELWMRAPRIDLGLEFANTVAWRGSTPAESIHNFAELLGWCARNGLVGESSAREYRALARHHPGVAARLFDEAIAIREALYRLFFSAASAAPAADGDVRLLNEALANAPARTVIERSEHGFGWRVERGRPSSALLAPALWSSADLLVGPSLARVRHCANPRCLWLFLDDSKNATRRWCSMQSCGNRAKAHRHYLRQQR